MAKPHHENFAHSLLKSFISLLQSFIAISAILLLPPALLIGFFALSLFELPLDMNDEARLIRHFERNQGALEEVVEKALATDIKSAKRASWNIVYKSPRRPEGKTYDPLFKAMRRAKVQEVWVRESNQPKVILITGTKPDLLAPDTQYFGYSRSLEVENEDSDTYKAQEEQLAPNWSLYWFFEG